MPQALWQKTEAALRPPHSIFGRERELEAGRFAKGYPGRAGIQLKRYGTNIAKWGIHVLSHPRFQRVSVARERDRQLVRDEVPDNLWMSDSIERLILDFEVSAGRAGPF